SGLERYTAATPSSKESQVIAAATSALLTFYRGRVHVIVVPTKSREEQDEIDIGGCPAGRGLRRERGAGAGLSVGSDREDRAVSGWRPDRSARSDHGRRHARVARANHCHREREGGGLDHRRRSRRPSGARRLYAEPRQLDEPHGGRRALSHSI